MVNLTICLATIAAMRHNGAMSWGAIIIIFLLVGALNDSEEKRREAEDEAWRAKNPRPKEYTSIDRYFP